MLSTVEKSKKELNECYQGLEEAITASIEQVNNFKDDRYPAKDEEIALCKVAIAIHQKYPEIIKYEKKPFN